MGKFVQIIEYTTSRFDEVKALGDQMADARAAAGRVRRVTVTSDRDRPNTYLTIAEFESYEAAMENSDAPETKQFAEQMMKLCDGPPTFYNLDVEATYQL